MIDWNRREFLAATAAFAACGGGRPACAARLTERDLDEGIRLCGQYLRTARTKGGDFVYELDWRLDRVKSDPEGVRQAGATFGIADHAARTRAAEDHAVADAALATWVQRRRLTRLGTTFIWGTGGQSRLGTTALLGLAAHARLAAGQTAVGGVDLAQLVAGVLDFVKGSRRPEGGFVERYDANTEKATAERSPYADGEALLFLTTAARGKPELVPDLVPWAEQDWTQNVAEPLAAEPDPDRTKGYYQWGSMSWANLLSQGIAPDLWGRRLTDLAVWMVDVHGTLGRTRNTAYAYEGLVPAYAEAKRRGDAELATKLACTIHEGLAKLCSWQLGHPLALPELAGAPESALGGVQNHASEPLLRIDVTQHQLHALWFAKESGVAHHFDA